MGAEDSAEKILKEKILKGEAQNPEYYEPKRQPIDPVEETRKTWERAKAGAPAGSVDYNKTRLPGEAKEKKEANLCQFCGKPRSPEHAPWNCPKNPRLKEVSN